MNTPNQAEQIDEVPIMMALTMLTERGLLPSQDYQWARATLSERQTVGALTQAKLGQAASLVNRHARLAAEHGIPVPELPGATAPDPQTTGAPRPGSKQCEVNVAPSGELIVTGTPYEMRDVLKTLPGHRYSRADKAWYLTASPAVAAMVGTIIQQHKLPLVMGKRAKALAVEHTRRRETAQILDPDSPVPQLAWEGVATRQPWEHQLRGAEYMMQSSATCIGAPMGSGKTAMTFLAMNLLEARRVLVVCPNPVRGVWSRESKRHSVRPWHVVDGRRRSQRARSGWVDLQVGERLRQGEEALFDCRCGRPHIMVINYEVLTHETFDGWAPRARFETLVYDEVHRLGSHAEKTKSGGLGVSGRAGSWVGIADHRWGLSGTPIGTDPAENLFGEYRALDPGIFGTVWTSKLTAPDGKPRGHSERYQIMNPQVRNHVIGYRNLAELARKASQIMYRPTVELDLPESTTETIEVTLDATTMKAYREMEAELAADLAEYVDPGSAASIHAVRARVSAEVRDAERRGSTRVPTEPAAREAYIEQLVSLRLENPETDVTAPNPMVKLLRLQQLTGGVLATDDGIEARVWDGAPKAGTSGTGKPSPKGEALGEALDMVGCTTGREGLDEHGWVVEVAPEPVVVFCRFSSDLAQVREVVEGRGLRYGEISGKRKDGLTVESTMAPDADVVGVQIQAGGTGIELVRARIVVWWSVGYSLVDFDQAVKRVHRPGQTRPVLNLHLVAVGTADEAVYEALNERRSTVASFYRLAGFRDEQVSALTAATTATGVADEGDGAVERVDGVEVPDLDDPVSSLHAGLVKSDLPWIDQADRLGDGEVYKRKRKRRKGAPTDRGKGGSGRKRETPSRAEQLDALQEAMWE